MKVEMIKHGKTDMNIDGRRQGLSNLSLNEAGRQEALLLKQSINIQPDTIYSSPLKRALETAQILFPKKEININELLIEYNFGELEGIPFSSPPSEFPDNKTVEYNGIIFILPNEGETFENITKRCQGFIDFLKEHHSQNENIAIVTHSTTMEIIKALIENKPWHEYLGSAKQFHGLVDLEL